MSTRNQAAARGKQNLRDWGRARWRVYGWLDYSNGLPFRAEYETATTRQQYQYETGRRCAALAQSLGLTVRPVPVREVKHQIYAAFRAKFQPLAEEA